MNANIYYSPEKFGLVTVGEVEWSDGSYIFDKTVVWRKRDSLCFYLGSDSGCSCPSPFEDIGLDDLRPMTPSEVIAELRAISKAKREWAEIDSYDKPDWEWGFSPDNRDLQVANLIDLLMAFNWGREQ